MKKYSRRKKVWRLINFSYFLKKFIKWVDFEKNKQWKKNFYFYMRMCLSKIVLQEKCTLLHIIHLPGLNPKARWKMKISFWRRTSLGWHCIIDVTRESKKKKHYSLRSLESTSQRMSHSSTKVSMQIYIHSSREFLEIFLSTTLTWKLCGIFILKMW